MKRLDLVGQFALRSAFFVLVMALLLGLSITFAVRQLFVRETVRTTKVTANAVVLEHLEGVDLAVSSLPDDVAARLDTIVEKDLEGSGIFAIKLWDRRGRLVYVGGEGEAEKNEIGKSFAGHEPLDKALRGQVSAEVAREADEENAGEFESGGVIEVYAPLTDGADGPVLGVFEVYQAYAPVAANANRLIMYVWAIILLGSIPAYFLQLTLVRRTAEELTSARGDLAEVNERLSTSLDDLEMHSLGTLQALVAAVDAKDSYTARHSIAVTDYAVATGKRMGLCDEEVADLERAGLLHDVGKIGTPETILLKPDRLSNDEFEVIQEHSEMGGHIVETVPFLSRLMPVVRSHHERWDGSGYPDGLAGEDIPLLARVLAVADAFDAMTSERPYRKPVGLEVARAELVRCSGMQFDPRCVEALLAALDAGEARVLVHAEAARGRARRRAATA